MGFLSSPLTESRQAAAQNSFALGLQMADATIRQNQAAAEQMQQMQLQHQYAQQAYEQQKADTLAYRKELAQERLQEATTKSLEDLTQRQVVAGIGAIDKSGNTAIRAFDDIVANRQGMWSPSTIAQASKRILDIGKITALGIQKLAAVRPGEQVDITGVMQAIGNLPDIKYEYDPSYLEGKKAEATIRNAQANSLSGKTVSGAQKEPEWMTGFPDAVGGLISSRQALTEKQKRIDAAQARLALAQGHDLFAPEYKAIDTYKTSALQWAAQAKRQLQNDPSDYGEIYYTLTQKGVDPFDVDNTDKTGLALYELRQNPNIDEEARNSIDRFSTMVTGRSTASFGPSQVNTPLGIMPVPSTTSTPEYQSGVAPSRGIRPNPFMPPIQ